MSNLDVNAHWYNVFVSAMTTITNHTLRRVVGGDNGTHGGGASPRLMWDLDNADGSGIGTSSAYHAQQYPRLRVVGIELATDRTQTARELYENDAGMGNQVEFVNGSFVDEGIWRDHVLRNENERVCVWMNAENFVKVDRLMLDFEQLAERLMVQPGSLIVSAEKLFQVKRRRSPRDGCPFVETRMAITLQEWDLSCLVLFYPLPFLGCKDYPEGVRVRAGKSLTLNFTG
eukprot:scaffold19184_cov46-Cyclotella_meneghiniana.AAC.14